MPWVSVDSYDAQGQSGSWLPFTRRDSRAEDLQHDWHADQQNLKRRLCGTRVGDGRYADLGVEHAGGLGHRPIQGQQVLPAYQKTGC